MTTHQTSKAKARAGAKAAPKADPEIAAQAERDAKAQGDAQSKASRRPVQPLYKTQTRDIAGDNLHHDKDAIVSDFDDPANNKVR